jgi:hypothetical protein
MALPVLYASQWFLTCFSCPFPATLACRVIDVMLQEQRSHVLLRIALAIVAECEADLLELDDFEDIITFLKVVPPSVFDEDSSCSYAAEACLMDMHVHSAVLVLPSSKSDSPLLYLQLVIEAATGSRITCRMIAAPYNQEADWGKKRNSDVEVCLALQVEPVKWPAQRMRKVLNNAILTGLVADEMFTAAEQALTDGFEGSLSRCAAPQLVP